MSSEDLLQFYENECEFTSQKQSLPVNPCLLPSNENELQSETDEELITQPEEIRQLERQSQRQLPKYWQDPQQVINESLQTVVVRQKLKHSFQQQQQQDPERVRELTSIQENDLERTQLQGIQTPYVLVPEPIRSGRVVVFDVETTGFSITDSIVELGAVELIDCVRTGLLFQSYAQPRCEIDPRAEAVHGLTKSKLRHAPPIQVVMASFLSWVGSSPLIAHNAAFDCRFLFIEMSRLHLTFPQQKQIFCTQTYFRRKYPGRSFGLNDVALFLGLRVEERLMHHSALVDAELLAQVYIHLATQSTDRS